MVDGRRRKGWDRRGGERKALNVKEGEIRMRRGERMGGERGTNRRTGTAGESEVREEQELEKRSDLIKQVTECEERGKDKT